LEGSNEDGDFDFYLLKGIDLNDPTKVVCCTMFLTAVLQHVKIGDLTRHQRVPLPEIDDDDDSMDSDDQSEDVALNAFRPFDPEEEDSLTRDSTAGFAGALFLLLGFTFDWDLLICFIIQIGFVVSI